MSIRLKLSLYWAAVLAIREKRPRLLVSLVRRKLHVPDKFVDLVNALQNVAKMSFGSLKGKNRFLQNLILNRFFQPFRRGQIDPCSEQIGKAVFEPSHGQKRIVLCLVEIGQ